LIGANHGASDAPPYGQRLSRHGKDLHELFDWLSLDAAYLVGGSMGASSIWAYFDLFSYARCRGMVSVDQTPKLLNVEGWNNGFYGLTPESLGTLFAAGISADRSRSRHGEDHGRNGGDRRCYGRSSCHGECG
jgi:pimeloyl-ACP methyl ester carboxylesterase